MFVVRGAAMFVVWGVAMFVVHTCLIIFIIK